jgi:hypothetical protein
VAKSRSKNTVATARAGWRHDTANATAPTSTRPAAKRGRAASARPRPSDPEFWTVINEISDPIPVAPAEFDAIESYFSAVLDAVFDPARKSFP